MKEVYIPCYLCDDVVREGSMRMPRAKALGNYYNKFNFEEVE